VIPRPFPHSPPLLAALIALLTLLAPPAPAQPTSPVTLDIPRSALGIEGVARAGDWSPARLTLSSSELAARAVVCRWLIRDADGDRLVAERRVVLNPGVDQRVWLYAPVPLDWSGQTPWDFEVVDADSGVRLAATAVAPVTVLPPDVNAIGLFTNAPLGLGPYTRQDNRGRPLDLLHERLVPVRSLVADRTPDRWFGLDLFNTLVWTADGDSFDAAAVSPDQQRALVEWVRRGGHLIISLPAVGDPWLGLPDAHPLKPLIPVNASQARRLQGQSPLWFGTALGGRPTITRTVFNIPLDGLPGVNVVAEDDNNQPLAIAHRHGFGRVTLVGVDLADRKLALAGLPTGRDRIWKTLLGWQAPAFDADFLNSQIEANAYGRPDLRNPVFLDDWVDAQTDRPGTVATALLLAILAFGLYWLLAGPVAYAVLRARKLTHRSWVVFAGLVAVFTAVTWVGALLLRPSTDNVTHFSVVDFAAGQADARVHSWFSLFLPAFGPQPVDLAPDQPDAAHLLASPGLSRQRDAVTYPDPQAYALDARAPHTYPPADLPNAGGIPFRSTAKTFTARYLGPLTDATPGLTADWVPPQGRLRIDNAFPVGELSHNLPGTLTDVVAVYCPGDGEMPWVWRLDDWAPQTILQLAAPTAATRLVRPPRPGMANRSWSNEGYLGVTFDNLRGGILTGPNAAPSADRLTLAAHLVSFFDYLPVVDYENNNVNPVQAPKEYRRALTRDLDLSPLVAGKRLILLGNLRDAPSPLPLTARGDAVPSMGWTLVRYIYDFD